MKILVINGSPKGERSNSLQLAKAFVRGLGEGNEVRTIHIANASIKPCRGCFCCWSHTPGKCVLEDDMASVIQDELWAELIIWSFPLYYFSVPGPLKNLLDRQLPMSLPFMTEGNSDVGSGSHPSRYDMSGKRHMLISTCGFYSAEKNYDSVIKMFTHICGEQGFEHIFCGQGELFRVPELKSRTNEYLATVERAGSEYILGGITNKTRAKLNELLFAKDVFETMADASWGIEKKSGKKEEETLSFTRQMAALYNKSSYDGKDHVLEICYTDKNATYQILLGAEGSKVFADGSLQATTRIETPWEVWLRISRGEIAGDAALAQGLYRVSGDFSLMINWDKYFGNEKSTDVADKENFKKEKSKKASLLFLLAPWIVFWVCVTFDGLWSSLVPLGVCLIIPLIKVREIATVYDRISLAAVGGLSIMSMFDGMSDIAFALGYLAFGLLWLVSCFTKEPLCAAYVKYGYGGDRALDNPIFMKTNYILAAMWGGLYLILSVLTFILYHFEFVVVSLIVNNSVTVLMSIFTAWFQKWYPAHVAAGKTRRKSK